MDLWGRYIFGKIVYNNYFESLILSICAESEQRNQLEVLTIINFFLVSYSPWLLNMELQLLDNGCLLHKVTELPITVICLVVFFFYYVIFWKHKLSSIKREQYCIGTWNVKSMNQGKLDVVKQEMAGGNINILGIN